MQQVLKSNSTHTWRQLSFWPAALIDFPVHPQDVISRAESLGKSIDGRAGDQILKSAIEYCNWRTGSCWRTPEMRFDSTRLYYLSGIDVLKQALDRYYRDSTGVVKIHHPGLMTDEQFQAAVERIQSGSAVPTTSKPKKPSPKQMRAAFMASLAPRKKSVQSVKSPLAKVVRA